MVFLLGECLILRSGIIIICIGRAATKVAAAGILAAKMTQARSTAVKYIGRVSNRFRGLRAGRNIGSFVLATANSSGIFSSCGFGIIAAAFAF